MLCALLFILLGVPAGLVYYYTRPAQLIPQVEAALAEASGCEVSVANARVNLKGELVLEGLVLSVPHTNGGFARLFEARRVDLHGPVWGMVDGSYAPHWVRIDQPVLHLTEAPGEGRFNFELIAPGDAGDDDFSIPEIVVRDAEIRFGEARGGKVNALASIHIEGALHPDPADPRWYQFVFNEDKPNGGEPGLNLTGRFDLDAPALELNLADFSYIDEYRFFMPPEFRRWSTRLAPTGRVAKMAITLGPDDRSRLTVGRAEIEFEQVGLNLNVLDAADPDQTELALLLRAIRTRLTDISGRLVIEDDRFTLTGQGLVRQTGLGLSEIAYDIVAQGGLDLEQGLSVALDTRPFRLEDRYEYVLAMMPLTGDAYRRFKPSGELALSAHFEKLGPDAPSTWGLDVDLIDAQLTHRMFPLTLRHITGTIHVTPESAVLKDMHAVTAGGASVQLSGVVTPPSDIAEVDLLIQIDNLPLDDELRAAMKPNEAENLSRFFDTESLAALQAKGSIATADDGSAPGFALGGEVNVTVPVYRPYGEEADYSIVPIIDLAGVNVLMRDFPYPATVDGGTVEVGPDFVVIHDLSITGLTGGGLTVSGRADKDPASGDYLPRLKLTETLLPIDGLLLHAIGGDAETLLTDLGVTGMGTISGELFQGPEDEDIDMALDIVVTEGRVQPYGGSVVFDRVEGLLHLKGKSIPTMSFTGRRGEATLGVSGKVAWTGGGDTTAELAFDADDFVLERELLEVLPPDSELRGQLTELYEEYEPAGKLDAELEWKPTGGDEPDEFVAQLHPTSLAFNYGQGRLTFEDLSGSVTVWPEYMQLNALGGAFADPPRQEDQPRPTGHLTATGEIGFDDQPRIGLLFDGHSTDALGQTVVLLMPEAVSELLETVQYQGPLAVENADLLIENTGGDDQRTSFVGSFSVEGTSLVVGGLPLAEVDGRMRAEILDEPGGQTPRMVYELSVDRLLAKDRLVTGLRGRADNDANRGVLRTGQVVGSMYGGTVVIEAASDLGAQGGAKLMAELLDVELGPLLKPETAAQPEEPAKPDGPVPSPIVRTLDTGLLSASMSLETEYGENASRLGRGCVRVRDAGLLAENGLELFMIQALNLNLPDRRGFDKAMAEFQIIDDAILLEQFSMETRGKELSVGGFNIFRQGLKITGAGIVSYPDLQLDLRMRSQIVGTAERVPFAAVIRSVRNELMALQVRGTLENPEVTAIVLPDTRESWDALLRDIRPIQEKAP